MLMSQRTVQMEATVDGPGNYFTLAMEDAYRICKEDAGQCPIAHMSFRHVFQS